MAQTITLTRFRITQDGHYEATFANSLSGETGRRWAALSEIEADVAQLEATEDVLVRYAMAYWLKRSADLSNPNVLMDKTLTVDFGAANPIRVQ